MKGMVITMKKLFAVTLLLLLCCALASGCAGKDEVAALEDRIEALEAALESSSESESAAKIAELEEKLEKAESKADFYEHLTDVLQKKIDSNHITYAEIAEAFGKDGVSVGSGFIIYQWELSNGDKLNVYFTAGKGTPDYYDDPDKFETEVVPYMIATNIKIQSK